MLAVVFGCTQFHGYIYGLKEIQIETDHKPLESIVKKPLHQAPMQLQRMILQIQKYPLVVTYRPGKELLIADTLSRAYLPDKDGNILDEELWMKVKLINTLPISENKLESIIDNHETLQDPPLQQWKQIEKTGWPERKYDCPHAITPYWNVMMKYLCTTVSCSEVKGSLISPHYPQSNGMAERAVQIAKRLLIKAIFKEDKKDPYLSLLELWNTPKSDLLGSPEQGLMGRRTKTLLPTS
jgi:hypothetical protein